jgi:protein TonB
MPSRSRPAILFSIAAHVALLACLLIAGTRSVRGRAKIIQPANRCCFALLEIAGGSHRLPLPGLQPPSTGQSHKATQTADTPRTANPTRPPHAAKANPEKPSQSTGTGTAAAATGSGSDDQNATPAFPIFSPKPPVTDRALLPSAEQQIVVDVSVSAQGDVVSETLVKGMGNSLDQTVLETVKTWRFQPATVNGNPVASESELIFPFNLSYPITRS